MILLSPISSGIKLVDIALIQDLKDLKKIKPIDQNRKLQDINCSVFLIHGLLDSVIPSKFTDNMKKRLIKSMSWFPTHGDHTNILTKYREEFYTKCLNFLNSMNYNFTYEASQYNDGKHKMSDLKLVENYIRNVSTSQTNNNIPSIVGVDQESSKKYSNCDSQNNSKYQSFHLGPDDTKKSQKPQIDKTSKFNQNQNNIINMNMRLSSISDESKLTSNLFTNVENDCSSSMEYDRIISEQQKQYEYLKNTK